MDKGTDGVVYFMLIAIIFNQTMWGCGNKNQHEALEKQLAVCVEKAPQHDE